MSKPTVNIERVMVVLILEPSGKSFEEDSFSSCVTFFDTSMLSSKTLMAACPSFKVAELLSYVVAVRELVTVLLDANRDDGVDRRPSFD